MVVKLTVRYRNVVIADRPGCKKKHLKAAAGISPSLIVRLSKNKHVSIDVLNTGELTIINTAGRCEQIPGEQMGGDGYDKKL